MRNSREAKESVISVKECQHWLVLVKLETKRDHYLVLVLLSREKILQKLQQQQQQQEQQQQAVTAQFAAII